MTDRDEKRLGEVVADGLREFADSLEIPSVDDQVDDHDGPWVLTYKDDGPAGISPGGGWPTRIGLVFEDYDQLRAFIINPEMKFGRNHKIDAFPLRQPTTKGQR